MSAEPIVRCRGCGVIRQPADLLLVEDRITGERFGVCRPHLVLHSPVSCFRQVVGPTARHHLVTLTPA